MYRLISALGMLLRTYLISNVFEGYFDNALIAYFANAFIGEPILYKTTYLLSVGSIYNQYSFPVLGSVLYTIFYFLNNGILFLSCYFCKLFNLDFYLIFIIYFVILLAYVYVMRRFREKYSF